MSKRRAAAIRVGAAGVALLVAATGASAQQGAASAPLSRFLLTGYGSAQYGATVQDNFSSNFTAHVSPILLYNFSPDMLFEAEIEFGLEEGATETELEYAQIDYQGFEGVQLIAGKFLIPFGVFGERLHPTWINKLPGMPLVYGHGEGGVPEGVLLPVLSDVGVMGRVTRPVGDAWSLDLSMYVTQGPRESAEEGDAATTKLPDQARVGGDPRTAAVPFAGAEDIPDVSYGTSFEDNNDNKMIGARLGVIRGGDFEAYVSAFHAKYDNEGNLDLTGGNVAAELREAGFEFRGEAAMLWQDFEQDAAFLTLKTPAYYLQASRRVGDFEPVVRWSHLLEGKVDGEVARAERRRLALGLDYWLHPSVPIKLAYEIELDGSDRLILQWAYGF